VLEIDASTKNLLLSLGHPERSEGSRRTFHGRHQLFAIVAFPRTTRTTSFTSKVIAARAPIGEVRWCEATSFQGEVHMSANQTVQTANHNAATTDEVMRRFNDVFQLHDPAALNELVAEDCVIENTQPAPNGSRHVGRDACVALWTGIATAPGTHFDLENVIVAGERAIILWRFWWGEGEANSVRGVNLMRVRDGLIVEAKGYVKGQG